MVKSYLYAPFQIWFIWNKLFMFAENNAEIITRGQFWPLGIVVACMCVSACMSINHEIVSVISQQLFKLGSPNLEQRWKMHCLRSLLFCEAINCDLQGQIELKIKI